MARYSVDEVESGAVIDIGGSKMDDNIKTLLLAALKQGCCAETKPSLPDELLYSDQGLQIWNEIIVKPEFYQTHDEIALFRKHGSELVKRCPANITIVDLGAGDTRKVAYLLEAFERARVPATYMALDISRASLEHNVRYLSNKHSSPGSVVTCVGLWGTFQDGMEYVQTITTPRLLLSLGSVLCNDEWSAAVSHLSYWAEVLRCDDLLLIGMDAHILPMHEKKIWAAYHSHDHLYKSFFMNGFTKANKTLGESWFREEDWDFLAELESKPATRHRFFWRAKRSVHIKSVGRTFEAGDEIDWFDSHKYGELDVKIMFSKAKLAVMEIWQAPDSEFRQYLLRARGLKGKIDANSALSGRI